MPEISVIVPAYNAEKFLSATLESVMGQTFTDWECIIVDDGSGDGTWKVAEDFCTRDSRFRLIRQPNAGTSAARNTGIDNAEGRFILPLDADDLIGAEYMEMAMAVFAEKPDTKLVYCKAWMFGDGFRERWPLPEYSYRRFIAINCIFCTCFFRRSDAVEIGKYDETFRHGYEDWDFLLRLLGPEDKVVRIDRELFFYRQHADGYDSVNTQARRNESAILKRIADKYPGIYGPHRERIISLMRAELSQEEAARKKVERPKLKSLLKRILFSGRGK